MVARGLLLAIAVLVSAAAAPAKPAEERIVFASNRTPLFPPSIYVFDPAVGRPRALTRGEYPVWAPDGRRFAFLRVDFERGVYYLMIANADGTGARRVAVDAGDVSPPLMWSPDGRRLAFPAVGPGLVVLDLQTGTRVTIPGVRVASWSPDGTRIVFTDDSSRLVTVASDGSDRRELTSFADGRPAWSPDGRTIAYLRTEGGTALYAISPDGTGNRPLPTGDQAMLPAWSPDGRRLAFVRDGPHSGIRAVFVLEADGTVTPVATVTAYDDEPPSWSRDGRRLAFGVDKGGVATVSSRGGRISVMRFGWPPRRVVGAPQWSPAASTLLFSSGASYNDFELYSARPDGTGLRALTNNRLPEIQPARSRDGRWIAFVRNAAGVGGIYKMRSNGSAVRRLTVRLDDWSPTFSPDGTRIAFVRDERIWVMRADGGGERRLSNQRVFRRGLAWSPDGSRLLFSRGRILTIRSDGTRPTPLTGGGYDIQPAWAPDGRRIAFTGDRDDRPERWGLYVREPDGTIRRIVDGEAFHASWSPDGRQLVFQRNERLFVVSAAGGPIRKVGVDDVRGIYQDAVWRT